MNPAANGLRAIVFDFGGVLMDWDPRHLYRNILGDQTAAEDFLAEIEFAAWNHEQDIGRTWADAVAAHSSKYPQHAELIRAYDERWMETVGGDIPGTVDILRGLKGAGYTLYGLSNWSAEKFALVRGQYPFFELFDGMVISGEVKMAKPDPRMWELVLEQTGFPAAECLFIDDLEPNIKVAQSLGFQTIQYQSSEQLARELRERGVLFSSGV